NSGLPQSGKQFPSSIGFPPTHAAVPFESVSSELARGARYSAQHSRRGRQLCERDTRWRGWKLYLPTREEGHPCQYLQCLIQESDCRFNISARIAPASPEENCSEISQTDGPLTGH